MSSDVRAVLLVPTEAHREALIGDGPCGSRAPVAEPVYDDAADDVEEPPRWTALTADRPMVVDRPGWPIAKALGYRALVLAWAGRRVGEGCRRLAEVLAESSPYQIEDLTRTIRDAEDAGRRATHLGRLVLLDADGREVTDGR